MQRFSSPLTLMEQEVALSLGIVLSGDALILVGSTTYDTDIQTQYTGTYISTCKLFVQYSMAGGYTFCSVHRSAIYMRLLILDPLATWELCTQMSHDTIMNCTKTHMHTHT